MTSSAPPMAPRLAEFHRLSRRLADELARLHGVPDDMRKQAETPWFSSFLAFDPSKVGPKVNQPLLVVQPALDSQVPPHHAEKLAALANARKKAPVTPVVTLPGVHHLLVPATTGEVDEYASLTARTITPDAAAKILEWLAALPQK